MFGLSILCFSFFNRHLGQDEHHEPVLPSGCFFFQYFDFFSSSPRISVSFMSMPFPFFCAPPPFWVGEGGSYLFSSSCSFLSKHFFFELHLSSRVCRTCVGSDCGQREARSCSPLNRFFFFSDCLSSQDCPKEIEKALN